MEVKILDLHQRAFAKSSARHSSHILIIIITEFGRKYQGVVEMHIRDALPKCEGYSLSFY